MLQINFFIFCIKRDKIIKFLHKQNYYFLFYNLSYLIKMVKSNSENLLYFFIIFLQKYP